MKSEKKSLPEAERPFPPELVEWAVAQYTRPKMLQVEISRRFFWLVKNNPGKLKLRVEDEHGKVVMDECPHRRRMPGEDELGTAGYETFAVLRKD
jgi:hypothetical protein